MKRIHPDSRLYTQVDYSEELKLNILCDDDNNHTAVLYCTYCRTNLCEVCADFIHSLKSLTGHKVVRLTEKPELPIKCSIHLHKIAELICKEPSCDGMNKPMCTMCHQYEIHKGHKYEILDNEFDQLRENVINCSKEIEEKRAICDKNIEEADKCILTYSTTDAGFGKSEREKIEKLYSEAKASALQTLDIFADNRIEVLKMKKNQYARDKRKLDSMSLKVRSIEKMSKVKLIENGDHVRALMKQIERRLEGTGNLIPARCFELIYPDLESMNVKMEINHDVDVLTQWVRESESISSFGKEDEGIVYIFKNGRSVLELARIPEEFTIDLSRYKYVFVIMCPRENKEEHKKQLKEQMTKCWWSRILIVLDGYDPEGMTEFMVELKVIAGTDKRVEFVKFESVPELFDSVLMDEG